MNNPNLTKFSILLPLLMGNTNTGIVKKRSLWFPCKQRKMDLFDFLE